MAVQRFGQISALSQFLLGATLGFGMSFWDSFLAITFGAVILEVVAIALGVIGMREGLSTSTLARWCGFGQAGSAVIGLAIGISLVGWFGVQSAVFAEGLYAAVAICRCGCGRCCSASPSPPSWSRLRVDGVDRVPHRARVPAAGGLVDGRRAHQALARGAGRLRPAGPSLTPAEGTTLVAGGFIVGAVITPDMTRFNRTVGDVVKQTIVGITLGEYVIGLVGVLLAHAIADRRHRSRSSPRPSAGSAC